jgi:hypothetical protein
MSHGFIFQNAARETPRIVSTTSIEMLSPENRPVSRKVWLRPSLRMKPTSTWLTATKVTLAARPATANRALWLAMRPPPCSLINFATPHAASAFRV